MLAKIIEKWFQFFGFIPKERLENYISKTEQRRKQRKEFSSIIKQEAYEEGKEDGYRSGFADAIKKKTDLISCKHCSHTDKESDSNLIPSSTLPFTDNIIQKIRSELIQKTGALEPTEAQWDVILCEQRNTRVIAGAGSGKTTTMILRAIVLRYYLMIPWKEITVLSFTNKSVEDFRTKLISMTLGFTSPISVEEANSVVTTFHAKVLKFKSLHHDLKGKLVFDQLGRKKKTDLSNSSKLTAEQSSLLRSCYEELYLANDTFKEKINYIRSIEAKGCIGGQTITNYDKILDKIQKRDKNLTIDVQPSFSTIFTSQFDCGEYVEITGKYNGKTVILHSNIYIADYNLHIVFHPFDNAIIASLIHKDYDGLNIKSALTVKTKTLWGIDNNINIYVIHNKEHACGLVKSLNHHKYFIPPIRFCLVGEPVKSIIWEYFYSFLGFIESLNLRPMDFVKDVLHRHPFHSTFDDCSYEYQFLEAFSLFNEYFQCMLENKDLTLYNTLFNTFSTHRSLSFSSVRFINEIKSMSNLIIDEFQDISPIIISWLQAVLKKLTIYDISSSLMVVGDDWQCIYGWRGSSPHILTDTFDEFFTSKSRSRNIQLLDNFRSGQLIIDKAEKAFSHSTKNSTKHGISAVDKKSVFTVSTYSTESTIVDKIEALLNCAPKKHPDDELYLMVLTTTNKIRDELESLTKNGGELIKGVLFTTIHKSKGLEAENVIVVGESYYPNYNYIKEQAYRVANFPNSFYESAVNEAKRIIYVAITRAKANVIYYIPQNLTTDGVITDIYLTEISNNI